MAPVAADTVPGPAPQSGDAGPKLMLNMREPLLARDVMTGTGGFQATVLLRRGENTVQLADAVCTHFNRRGSSCTPADGVRIQEHLSSSAEGYQQMSFGAKVVNHLRFGWQLFLGQGSVHEARLQFMHAL